MLFNLDKFEYVDHYITNADGSNIREIIALAHYNGKTYKGHARCHPDDTFDFATGKLLAARRCDLAIRRARFSDRVAYEYKMADHLNDAEAAYKAAVNKSINAENDLIEAERIYGKLISDLEN